MITRWWLAKASQVHTVVRQKSWEVKLCSLIPESNNFYCGHPMFPAVINMISHWAIILRLTILMLSVSCDKGVYYTWLDWKEAVSGGGWALQERKSNLKWGVVGIESFCQIENCQCKRQRQMSVWHIQNIKQFFIMCVWTVETISPKTRIGSK